MLPSMNKLNRWKNAQVVRVESFQLYFSLHDDCPTCRGLIGFEVDGHPRVVCDISEKRGGITHTTAHRKFLQPNTSKWVSLSEFARLWIEQTSIPAGTSASCSGPTCSLPTIGFFGESVSAKVVVLGPLELFFSYDNSGFWPDLVAFQMEGQEPVVGDLSNWPSPWNTVRTAKHRTVLEPDRQKWLNPVELHQRWLECAKGFFEKDSHRQTA